MLLTGNLNIIRFIPNYTTDLGLHFYESAFLNLERLIHIDFISIKVIIHKCY